MDIIQVINRLILKKPIANSSFAGVLVHDPETKEVGVVSKTELLKPIQDQIEKINNPDGFLKTGKITKVGNTVSIQALSFVWKKNNVTATNYNDFSTVIASATEGFYRTDSIYAKLDGTFIKIEGVEGTEVFLPPDEIENALLVTNIAVFGSVTNEPIEPFVSEVFTLAEKEKLGALDATLKEDKNQKGVAGGYVPLNEFIKIESQYLSIVDDLVTGGSDSLLSAEQGKLLQTQVNTIENFTEQKVRDTVLTGLGVPTATGTWTITATDKIITALGKMQYFINHIFSELNLKMRKVDVKWNPYNGSGVTVLPNNSDIACFDIRSGVTEILGYSSGPSFMGLIYSIKNTQATDIILRHQTSSSVQIRFNFQDGLDYILKPGHIVRFSYVGTGPTGDNTGGLWFMGLNLTNVNNTSDANKPVSTATQTALNLKLNKAIDYSFDIQVYGIQYDNTIAAPEVTRIGNMQLHADLPIQSLMRRCLVTDAGIVTYLNATDSTKKPDGSAADLSGAAGQVMVEIPEYYRRFTQEGNISTVLFSLINFNGATRVPKKYVSAFKATVQRSTSKLSSVVNTTTDYRGGGNNASLDAAANTNLGKPATDISRINFKNYANNRGANWTDMDYQVRKDIYWLITTEYGTRQHQTAFNAAMTAEGYRQGGLGTGPTDIVGSEWGTFNGYYPIFNCGTTLSAGNASVNTAIILNDFPSAGLTRNTQTNSYRGVENFFGDIWEWTDGVNIKTNNGISKIYVKNDKSLSNDTDYFNYRFVGNMPSADGYISKVVFGSEGDILPKEVTGASATTFFSDYYYQNNPATETLRGLLFGGHALDGAGAGSAGSTSNYVPAGANTNIGSRLCFLP